MGWAAAAWGSAMAEAAMAEAEMAAWDWAAAGRGVQMERVRGAPGAGAGRSKGAALQNSRAGQARDSSHLGRWRVGRRG